MSNDSDEMAGRVQGVSEIYLEVREAAGSGRLRDLQMQEWPVQYTGALPPKDQRVMVQVTPAEAFEMWPTQDEAFEMSPEEARDFTVTLVDANALITPLGQLRDMGVKVTKVTDDESA